jgi:2-polyprenyl-3-methyl-5-hydroxy-6-metoxy-1,4-benzoquinol methylase
MNLNLFNQHQLDIGNLVMLQKRPEPFTPGEPRFWDDPHISKHMLAAHLDSQSDLASRKPETIDASVAWIMGTLQLQAGDHVLDLGCGPGLYSNRLAQLGLQVTGVDYSNRSIEYARWSAEDLGLAIAYRCQDYLTLEDEGLYDAALLIYGEYCVFNPAQRRKLLANVRKALKPGGYFVFDVSTPNLPGHQGEHTEWQALETGFWRAGPHLVLSQRFEYPDEMIYLDQYLVIEADGTLSVYRNWFQDFEIEGIVREVEAAGLVVKSVWGDLTGEPYSAGCEWIGLVVEKM